MKKTFVYLILLVFSVYFSFVIGNVLGDLEGGGHKNISSISTESYAGGTGGGLIEYFNPFKGFNITSSGLSYSLENASYNSNGKALVINKSGNEESRFESNSGSNSGLFGSSFNVDSDPSNEGVMHSGNYNSKNNTKRNKHISKDNDPFASEGFYINPNFDSRRLLSEANRANGQSILVRSNSKSNPTGTFGAKIGESTFSTLSEDEASVPNPTPIPLDSGSIFLIVLGLLLGSFSIIKVQKMQAKIS